MADRFQIEREGNGLLFVGLTMYAALRCVTLKRAYDEQDEAVPASRMFDDQEQELLSLEIHNYEKGA